MSANLTPVALCVASLSNEVRAKFCKASQKMYFFMAVYLRREKFSGND